MSGVAQRDLEWDEKKEMLICTLYGSMNLMGFNSETNIHLFRDGELEQTVHLAVL